MLFSGDALRLCKCDGVPYLCNRLKCYLSGDALHGSGSRINPIKCHRSCVIHYFPDPLGSLHMYIQHFVYVFVNDSLPKSLSHIFEYNRDIHRHNTRHNNDPRPLKTNSDIMRRSLLCRGPILWMDLNIRNLRTKHIFKKESCKIFYEHTRLNHREWCTFSTKHRLGLHLQ